MIFLIIVSNFLLKKLIVLFHKLCNYQILFKAKQMSSSAFNLAMEWLNPNTKQFLKQRIRSDAKGQLVETSDSAVAEQYYRMWLEVPTSNPLQRLARHPLLTVQDKKTIDEYVFNQQKSQLQSASLMTAACLAFYWLFLSRTAFFQNVFNNKERHRAFNIGRKGIAAYLVFLASMITMNSHYEKKIPNGLNDMGLFKRYRINFKEKYV